MKKILIIVLISTCVLRAEQNLPYTDAYDDQMLYLHSLINYNYIAQWQFDWEKRQFKANGFRITVGSVTTTDLLTDWGLFINQDLGVGWRFQGIGIWNETRHKNIFEKYAFMGLEKRIYEGLHVHLLVNPSYFKENTDLNAGFSIYDASFESYLRVAFQQEDFVYDSKNDFAGKTVQEPYSATWNARVGKDHFWFYTEGRLSTGFKRTFPDLEKSPDLRSHDQTRNDVLLKFYYTPDSCSITMLGVHFYQFSEKKTFSSLQKNYAYENQFNDFFVQHINQFHNRHRIRIQANMIIQDAAGQGHAAHKFERRDILAGTFYEYLMGRHIIEIGYMFSRFDFTYKGYTGRGDFDDKGYTDKVKLGWFFIFPNDAQINISLSHQVSIGGFGGANLQYIMFF